MSEIRIIDLPECTNISDDDYLLLEQNDGTKKVKGSIINEKLIDLEDRMTENIAKQYLEVSTDTGHMKVENCYNGRTKDLSIKGRTLQNLANTNNPILQESSILESSRFSIKWGSNINHSKVHTRKNDLLKLDTDYTIVVDIYKNNTDTFLGYSSLQTLFLGPTTFERNFENKLGRSVKLIRTFKAIPDRYTNELYFGFWKDGGDLTKEVEFSYMLLEGDWTNKTEQIPSTHFEGIKSLGEEENKISILSTGKNLFDEKWINNKEINQYGEEVTQVGMSTSSFVKINKGIKYNRTMPNKYYHTYLYDNSKRFIRGRDVKYPFVAEFNGYIRFCIEIDQRKDFMLVASETIGVYDSYKQDKKDILLPLENGCKSLPSGVGDEKYDNGNYVQTVGREEFNGAENGWVINDIKQASTIRFYIPLPAAKASYKSIDFISNFIKVDNTTADNDFENFQVAGGHLLIRINRSRLATEDLAGFIEWLKVNPIIIYYELQKYITYKSKPFTLATFKEVTHIHCLNNIVPSNVNAKLPVNLPDALTRLTDENKSLEKENTKLKNEIISAKDFLSKQDDGLLSNDLELDFRLFELELYLQIPLKANVGQLNKIAMTPYEMMKALVFANKYNRADFEYKSNRYLDGKRINQEEYDELRMLMDANEVTS